MLFVEDIKVVYTFHPEALESKISKSLSSWVNLRMVVFSNEKSMMACKCAMITREFKVYNKIILITF